MNEFYRIEQRQPDIPSNPQAPIVSVTAPRGEETEQLLSSASSYANLDYLFGVQDIKMLAPKASRNRRRPSDPSHIKHRRTRSGCYTCRSRRVKCDEGRPNCERCKKGSRECVYPEPTTAKASGSKSTQVESHDSSSGEEDGDGEYETLEAIPDEQEEENDGAHKRTGTWDLASARRGSSQPSIGPKSTTRHGSETPSLVNDKGASPTPSTEGSVGYSSHQPMRLGRSPNFPPTSGPEGVRHIWAHLAPDLQFYLAHFYDNITYMHYSFKNDPRNFLHTVYLDAALTTDALLYGMVGFSAFQRTLHHPDGKIEDFLPYYNKAVSLLLSSLKRGEKHEIGILMAILQLATIEEFLGDWINLIGHQKAAFEIITELYTPESMLQTSMSRMILSWYMRFDVFAGLLGGFQTVLSREWFTGGFEFYRRKAVQEPDEFEWKVEATISQYRLLAMDMSLLFARMGKGEISFQQFEIENALLSKRMEEWDTKMDPALKDAQYLVSDFTGAPYVEPDNIVDPYAPGFFYRGPLYPMNIARMDWISVDVMHKYQTALITNTSPPADLMDKAYLSCQLFEAIELWPESPRGTILCLQASLGISCLFLPRDDKHAMWGRRKLATIEANGYIYPYTFRSKMADLFRDRSCMHWWLPNDEGYPTIVRSIRTFVEERTTRATDTSKKDLKEMKTIFAALKLSDDEAEQQAEGQWKDSGSGTGQLQDMSSTGVIYGEAEAEQWQPDQMR